MNCTTYSVQQRAVATAIVLAFAIRAFVFKCIRVYISGVLHVRYGTHIYRDGAMNKIIKIKKKNNRQAPCSI